MDPDEINAAIEVIASSNVPKWAVRTVREMRDELAFNYQMQVTGLLPEKPCKIGDTVYSIKSGSVLEGYIEAFIIIENAVSIRFRINKNGIGCVGTWGKTIFPSIEEAEKALHSGV